jgi:glycerophosphoryl diester phosphodiesterase
MNVLLDPAAKLVIAHRGNSAFAPENTLESFQEGMALGADALEFDVHVSRDGKAVVIHDPTLERTTNGAGAVSALTLEELQRLDAGYHFTRDGGRTYPFRARGITIPSLEFVLSAFPGVAMILEIKTRHASAEVKRVLTAAGAAGRVLVAAFDDAALVPFRDGAFSYSASRRELVRLFARALVPGNPPGLPYKALAIPPSFKGIPIPVQRFARMARHSGMATHVWTVDDTSRAQRYWAGAVNGIITNDPGTILASIRCAGSPSRSLSPAA